MKELEKLKHIQKVETPYFLKTRIEAKIQELNNISASPKFVFNTIASFVIVLALNITFIWKSNRSEIIEESTYLNATNSTIQLQNSNQLYAE